MKNRTICLSFDFEECDLPRESGIDFRIEDGMRISREGAIAVLDILKRHNVKATFFCTLNFAQRAPEIMKRIIDEGHEVAAHGVDHFHQRPDDPIICRNELKRLYDVDVHGYRQPRMFPIDNSVLKNAGYEYNSSLNPAFVPGRYCHFATPRRPFVKHGLLQIPASVVPIVRFPLFWLALHLLPQKLYHLLVRIVLRWDGFLVTYFHPWEFSGELESRAVELKVPMPIKINLGVQMRERLERFIVSMLGLKVQFSTIEKLIEGIETTKV